MNNGKKVYKFALEYALKKIEKNMEELKDSFSFVTVNGKWAICKEEDWDLNIFSDGYWCNGFWTGMLWLAYKVTKNDKFKKKAYELCKLIESRKNSNKTHDLGFLFSPSFCVGYEITKDNYLKNIALDAANSLLSRFNDKISAITVSGDLQGSGLTAIDTMMNLPLLWWAYEKTGDRRYYEVACKHAITTIQHFIREDSTTYHIVEFDPNNGQVVRKATLQGYEGESCWSRGQAWAIYGFALAYETSNDKQFLEVAENLADYFIRNLPDDYVPYWDFNDLERWVKDSSAAAIACSGLLTLSELSKRKEFREIALKILDLLCSHYLAEENKEGILKHGCFHKPEGIGVDESLIWGDFYFVEALVKVKGKIK